MLLKGRVHLAVQKRRVMSFNYILVSGGDIYTSGVFKTVGAFGTTVGVYEDANDVLRVGGYLIEYHSLQWAVNNGWPLP
jgi:hypothetical protein